MEPAVTLSFLGAAQTVTGSKYLLEVEADPPRRILVDAGQFQGEKKWRLKNWDEFPVPPDTIDTVLLTHAHMDHVGYLPALVKQGFKGLVLATEGTVRLAEIVLRDAGKLQEQDAKFAADKGYSRHSSPKPLFTTEEVEATLPLLRAIEFDQEIALEDGITARWVRAGHILGSASIRVGLPGTSVVFSGDLGRDDHPILKPRETPPGASYVVMESTYGDREHPEPDLEHEVVAEAIRRTVERRGQVIMPAFAIDRTEAILKSLTDMYHAGRIPDIPVFVDSPMGIRALKVYTDTSLGELREGYTPSDFLGMPTIRATVTTEDSKALNAQTQPCIIISSSGMAEGGRVLHHLKRTLPDRRNTVILTGFQSPGTRGRALEEGAERVKIHGGFVPVRAEIVRDKEYSVHADASDLLGWAQELDPAPRQVFLVHGEYRVSELLAARMREELGWEVQVPGYGDKITLTCPIPGL